MGVICTNLANYGAPPCMDIEKTCSLWILVKKKHLFQMGIFFLGDMIRDIETNQAAVVFL